MNYKNHRFLNPSQSQIMKDKKALEGSIFTWILALFIIFFIIIIMDIFAFALIVQYRPEHNVDFNSGSVSALDNQYFLNTLAITERPDYNLLDRTKESMDDFFEIKNNEGDSLPKVFGLDKVGNPSKWKLKDPADRDGPKSTGRPFEIYGFDEGTPGKIVEIVSNIDESQGVQIRLDLGDHCNTDSPNPYFFQGPFGILRKENIVASTVPVENFNRVGGELARFRYSSIIAHLSTYRGSDFILKYRVLKECFDQINTEREDE